MHTILKRNQNEITRKVFEAQKLDPKKGDFVQQIKDDKAMIKLGLSDQEIKVMDQTTYQKIPHTGDTESLDRCGS